MFIRMNEYAAGKLSAVLTRIIKGELSVDEDTESVCKDVVSKLTSN